jgi:micrococcal nuclease
MSEQSFQKMPDDRFHRRAIMLKVVDGDTIDVEIDLGWSMKLKERLRLEGLDTPEIRHQKEKEAGIWVKQKVEKLLRENTSLIVTSMAYDRKGQVRGKYGRTMAVIYRAEDGFCLNEYLIKEKLAWRTNDNGSLLEERNLSSLTGIPEEKRK